MVLSSTLIRFPDESQTKTAAEEGKNEVVQKYKLAKSMSRYEDSRHLPKRYLNIKCDGRRD